MDKIFHSTFDFFTHALPGFCIVLSFFIMDPQLNTARDFLDFASTIGIGGGIFLLIIGYLTGFGINPVGRWMYRKIGFYFWKRKIENDINLFISDKYVLIRDLSPANFRYVEIWNMYTAMAHNLALAALVTCAFILIKLLFYHPVNTVFWLTLGGFALMLFIAFLHRAVVFSLWAAHDLNASLSALKLRERALSRVEAGSKQQ